MDEMNTAYCPVSIKSNYSDDASHGIRSLPKQTASGIDFFFLRHGNAVVTINRMSYMLESDQCACLMPGSAFSVRSTDPADMFFYDQIVIDRDFLTQADHLMHTTFFADLIARPSSLPQIITTATDDERALQLLSEIVMMLKTRPPQHEIGCTAAALMLLQRLSVLDISSRQTLTEDKNIGKVIRYIENNYMEKISIDKLASICCMSKYHFIRHFCEVTQQTPIEYINSYRIRVACRRLKEDTDEKVISIALSAGFNDLSNFNRIFKRIIGVTPAEYRRRELKKQEKQEYDVIYYASEDQAPAFYYFFP